MRCVIAWVVNHLPVTSVKKEIFFHRIISYLLNLCCYFNTQIKRPENEDAE